MISNCIVAGKCRNKWKEPKKYKLSFEVKDNPNVSKIWLITDTDEISCL